ncbi:MAG TPA: ABC transporter substrate-binding protein [Candidatus Acidoferrales bacterium]|nr:ABC transporter substrate-binding protein [Candidatus Acidoferrales bacterium]
MTKIKRIWLCLSWLSVLAVPFSLSASEKLVIGYTAITGIKAGLWIAEEGKIFEKYGIDPSIILITTASKMAQAMMAGEVPFAGAGGIAAVSATLSGGDFVMVGALAKVPAFYIMAMPEIKSIKDLRGKAVGVARFNSATDFTMRYVLRANGLEPDRDVKMIQTGDVFAGAAAMSNGLIVAAPFSSPANLKAEEIGARLLLNMGKAGVYFPHDAWMARRSFIDANGDLVLRFMKAYSEGVFRLHTDPALSRRAIQRYTRATDPQVVEAVYRYALDYVEKIPYNTREGIQEILNQLSVTNPKAKTARPETFYDDRFVKELETSGFYKQLWGK